jgi:hypothetical protein
LDTVGPESSPPPPPPLLRLDEEEVVSVVVFRLVLLAVDLKQIRIFIIDFKKKFFSSY